MLYSTSMGAVKKKMILAVEIFSARLSLLYIATAEGVIEAKKQFPAQKQMEDIKITIYYLKLTVFPGLSQF